MMGVPSLVDTALEGRTNSVTPQPLLLTRADVREEIQAALAEFAENALGRELDRLGTQVQEAVRSAMSLQSNEDFRAALDEWWETANQGKNVIGTHPRKKSDSDPQHLMDIDSTTSGSGRTTTTWPVDHPPTPFSLPAMMWKGDNLDDGTTTPTLASPQSPFSAPATSPSSPMVSFHMLSRKSGSHDWRRSFVERATKVNRRVEFLYGAPFRESHEMNAVVEEVIKAFEIGIKPHLVEDGLGGTYFVKDRAGRSVAVFKPRDEEPLAPNNPKVHMGAGNGVGLKDGVLVGEAAINEYAAFLLDQACTPVLRAGVQPTSLVRVANSVFYSAKEDRKSAFLKIKDKVGSLQLYAPHECTSEDLGWNSFPVDQVHRIAALDIRMCNSDRHSGNLLVQKWLGEVTALIPIDHGYALPDEVGGATFEWLSWPAAKKPFSDKMREEILAIDSKAIEVMMRKHIPVMRSECLVTLRVCTALLQHGVKAGLTAFDIGTLMTRPTVNSEPSPFEKLIKQARWQENEPALREQLLIQLIEAKCQEIADGGTQSQG